MEPSVSKLKCLSFHEYCVYGMPWNLVKSNHDGFVTVVLIVDLFVCFVRNDRNIVRILTGVCSQL